MSPIRARLRLATGRNRIQTYGRVSESALKAGWDADDAPGWTNLSGPSANLTYENLTGVERATLIKALTSLFRRNGVAKSIINLVVGFSLGGDIKFTAKSPQAQRVLDKFWQSPWNNWKVKLFRRMRDWRLYGEQLWPIVVNPVDGFVAVSYVSPARLKTIHMNADSQEIVDSVTLYADDGNTNGRNYRIVSPELLLSGLYDPHGLKAAYAFLLRANVLTDDPRGYSDILALTDWFEALDDLLFTSVERAAQGLSWSKHVKVADVNEVSPELESDLTRRFQNAKPGSVAITSGNISVEDVIPKLAAAETAEEAASIVKMISGSSSLPAAWLGFGEDQARTNLDRINGPTMKMLDGVRRDITYHIETVFQFVLHMGVLAGTISPNANLDFEIELPSIAEEDSREWSRAIAQVTTAAMIANRNGFITRETGANMISRVVDKIGVVFDPAIEVADREQEEPLEQEGDTANYAKAGAAQTEEPAAARNNQ